MHRVRLIVRADLPSGSQGAQLVHAAFDLSEAHGEETARWKARSNTVALLEVPDQDALLHLWDEAQRAGAKGVLVREPDLPVSDGALEGEATSVALLPSKAAKRVCKDLDRALGGR